MELFRLFAYSVIQQKGAGEGFIPPSGGSVDIVDRVTRLLNNALADAERSAPTRIQLRVDPRTRTSPVLQAIEDLAGPDDEAAAAAGLALAGRLNRVMDMRSKEGLLIAAVRRPSARARQREVVLWVFPRDVVLQHHSSQHRIEVVEDVFSQSSQQRKLALFEGRRLREDLRTGRVLDFQARAPGRRVAAFWIDDFLEADPDLSDETGSRLLADAFVRTSARLAAPGDLDQVQDAVITLRHAPARSRSFDEVGEEFLADEARRVFDEEAKVLLPDSEARRAQFRLQREIFGQYVNYRFFRLGSGTQVIAPVDEINRSVMLTGTRSQGQQVVLHAEGVVVEDKMTRRRVKSP